MRQGTAGNDLERPDPDRRGQVLVVDDSASQRRVLRAFLERWGYVVTETDGGQTALALCRERQFDVIISDWMMPGMSGLDLCREFRALDEKPYSYFILLTSRSEKVDVARGLDVGADDFIAKPVAPDELLARVRAGERILAMERELRERNELVSRALAELSELYEALDRDLIEARNLQQSLIRERSRDFGTAQVSLMLQPSGHIGGDMVGFFPAGETELGIYAIDVSGHGVASALLTARLAAELSGATAMRNIALAQGPGGGVTLRPPAEVAQRLNRLMLEEISGDQYFTMTLGGLDLSTGRLRLVQCGAPGAMVQAPDGAIRLHEEPGFPVGMFAAAEWRESVLQLAPGSRLLIYSDGITECENVAGQALEADGLMTMLADARGQDGTALLDSLVWRLSAWSGDRDFADDISALLLEFSGSAPGQGWP